MKKYTVGGGRGGGAKEEHVPEGNSDNDPIFSGIIETEEEMMLPDNRLTSICINQ